MATALSLTAERLCPPEVGPALPGVRGSVSLCLSAGRAQGLRYHGDLRRLAAAEVAADGLRAMTSLHRRFSSLRCWLERPTPNQRHICSVRTFLMILRFKSWSDPESGPRPTPVGFMNKVGSEC